MDEIRAKVRLANTTEQENAKQGYRRDEDVRDLETDGIVDTGATHLMLPEEIVRDLGLGDQGTTRVGYADERAPEEIGIAGPVTVTMIGRSCRTDCLVGRLGTKVVIGEVVLRMLDLIADGTRHRVAPRDPAQRMAAARGIADAACWNG